MTEPPVRVTVDANLLASGALRRRADAAPVRLLDTWGPAGSPSSCPTRCWPKWNGR